MSNNRPTRALRIRRGFTLIELLVAGVIAAFVIGSVSFSLAQVGRSRTTSKLRFDAHLRADAALTALRRDVVTVTRTDDLFYTRLLLYDDAMRVGSEVLDRDELIVFNTRLRPLRDISFNGEGLEYETQLRIVEDDYGAVLWERRDPLPDQYPLGGGMASPLVEGVVGLSIQAFDGEMWYEQWDSDIDGLPQAVRITVTSSGNRGTEDAYTAPRAVLRTIVPIDRVLIPRDNFAPEEDEQTGDGTDLDGDGVPDDSQMNGDGGGGMGTGGPRSGGGGGPDGPGGPGGPGGGNDGSPFGPTGPGPRPGIGKPRPGIGTQAPPPTQSGGNQ